MNGKYENKKNLHKQLTEKMFRETEKSNEKILKLV